jgi:hypothetical protein
MGLVKAKKGSHHEYAGQNVRKLLKVKDSGYGNHGATQGHTYATLHIFYPAYLRAK